MRKAAEGCRRKTFYARWCKGQLQTEDKQRQLIEQVDDIDITGEIAGPRTTKPNDGDQRHVNANVRSVGKGIF